jgi:hypothetical protein
MKFNIKQALFLQPGFFHCLFFIFENGISSLLKLRNRSSFSFSLLLAILFPVTVIVWIWFPRFHYPYILCSSGLVAGGVSVAFALVFVTIALKPQNLKDRIIYLLHEDANEKFDEILSGLTQTATSVAALNTLPESKGFISESFLRQLDRQLEIKETVSSLEKVIQARKRNVDANVNHIREAQYRASRAATAAAGGVFTGFFTFEVGESVLKYMHLVGKHDDRSMFFWFTTEAGPQSHIEVVGSHTGVNTSGLEKHFDDHFLGPEVTAYAGLLTLTLLVSVMAAIIGWRKPKEEQAGGHGGHH